MKLDQAVRVLESLSQESRLRVFRLLVRAGADGMPAGEVARKLKLPPPTLSFHLTHLLGSGLIEVRREGRSKIYAISVPKVRCLLVFLMEDCCDGRPELCADFSDISCEIASAACGEAACGPNQAKPRRQKASRKEVS